MNTDEAPDGFLKRIEIRLAELGRKRPWLAQETGIALGTINSWFTQKKWPGTLKSALVAQALGIWLDYLTTGGRGAERREGEEPGGARQEIELLLNEADERELEQILGAIKAVLGSGASSEGVAGKKGAQGA